MVMVNIFTEYTEIHKFIQFTFCLISFSEQRIEISLVNLNKYAYPAGIFTLFTENLWAVITVKIHNQKCVQNPI